MKIILRLGGKKYSINSPVKSPWTRRTWCDGSTDEECDWLIRTSTPSRRPVSRDGRPLPPRLDVIGHGPACAPRTASAATHRRNDMESHMNGFFLFFQLARPWPEKRTKSYLKLPWSDSETTVGAEREFGVQDFVWLQNKLFLTCANKCCRYSPQEKACWNVLETLKYYGKECELN